MATRYWVGGSGTWDDVTTTNWSTSSGGAGGASAPTSSDNVVFDSNSGTGSDTVTLSALSPGVCAGFKYDATALIVISGNVGVAGTFETYRNASSALEALEVYMTGTSIYMASNTYIKTLTLGIAGTVTATYNIWARYLNASLATLDLGTYSAYVNRTALSSSGTITNGTVYFSGYSAGYETLSLQGNWSGVTVYVQTGSYPPIIVLSSTAGNAGSLVFNATGTVYISGSNYAKNITVNAGALQFGLYAGRFYCYGTFYLASGASMGPQAYLYMQKVTGSPTATRTLRLDGDVNPSAGTSQGIRLDINCGADTINVTGGGGGLGSNTKFAYSIDVKTTTNFSCTNVYSRSFVVSASVACDISALTGIYTSTFSNYSISLVPGSCAINFTDYLGGGVAVFTSSAITFASVNVTGKVAVHFIGNNTVGNLTCSSSLGDGSTRGLYFDPSTTQTVTGTFTLSGASASDMVYLGVYGGGAAANISKASGTVTAAYANISNSNATGGATFKAPLATNVNGGNNTGWIFSAAGVGNFFPFF